MNRPLISVLINNHNYGRFLRGAIDSVLQQSYRAVEIIVVDDGSTDRSREIIRSYGHAVVPVLKANGGQDSAFNAGFARSRGEIICFLDADDKFVPDKLAKVVDCLSTQPWAKWCFHSLLLRDIYTGETVGRTRAFPGQTQDYSTACDFRTAMRWGRLPFYPMSTSGLCFRRSLLANILPMPETFINTSADRYIRSVVMATAPGYFIADDLTIQGIHDSNICTLRADRPFLLERQLVVAALLRARVPAVTLYANRVFARGLCAYYKQKHTKQRNCKIEPEYELAYERLISDYYKGCSGLDRFAIALIRAYHSRPQRQEYSFRPVTAPAPSPRRQKVAAGVRS
ncbi:MAG: glycosyltransferase family 2 protein [Phormidesmis sp.]